MDFPILSLVTFLPLIGAVLLTLLKGDEASVASKSRMIALAVTTVTFVLSLPIMINFNPATADYQFVEKEIWFDTYGISYHMGIDGISLFFVMLSTFLTPLCILASWKAVEKRVREYMVAFLLLETFMIGTFCALDAVLFYLFFEAVLIPMYIIIGVWGGARRVYASFKFFLYTLLGSVLMLVALITMILHAGTADMTVLTGYAFAPELQKWLWLAFFASFAVKMPMWPVHTWLPDAHVEAPTAGSVILAGVLLKMGGYGFLRFSLPMFPDATEYFAPMVFALSVIAIIYTSLVALVQQDMKKMIAYSSVAHMGFVTLGIFTLNTQGIEGAIFQMISHGVISAALFLSVGVVYDRLHTRDINRYGNLAKNMPIYAVVFVILMLGSVGLPGTSGFVGEFLALLGAYKVNTMVATFAAVGVVLGATYMLHLTRKVVFGPKVNDDAAAMPDLDAREKFIFLPLIILVIWLGVAPSYVLDRIAPSVQNLIGQGAPVVSEEIPAATSAAEKADDLPLPTEEAKKDKDAAHDKKHDAQKDKTNEKGSK
jgi:NADH-quinone oxidoreductase subunit M